VSRCNALLLIVVSVLASCAPVEPSDPIPPGPDAGTCEAIETGHDACGIAARHVRCELGCEGFGSSGIDRVPGNVDDDSFAEACRGDGEYETTCLASAETCAEAERCK
jgi:hypothetical protein